MSESPGDGVYRPERKFGNPEDQDQYMRYLDEDGNEYNADEFRELIAKEAEQMRKAGKSSRSPTITMPPLPGEGDSPPE